MPPRGDVARVTNPFAQIEKLPLFTTSQLQASRYAIVLDPAGANVEAGIVSKDYNLVENSFVVEAAKRVLDRAGFNASITKQIWDGRHFLRRYTIDDPSLIIDADPGVGDLIAASLDVRNSYDGTAKFGILFNLTRLACLNGMRVDHLLGGFTFKHNASNEEEFEREVEAAVAKLMGLAPHLRTLAPRFQRLNTITMGRADFLRAADKLKISDNVAMDVLRATEGDSAWSLLNGFTSVYTEMGTFPSEEANRKAIDHFLAMVD